MRQTTLDLLAYAAGCVGSLRRCQPFPLGRTLRILRDPQPAATLAASTVSEAASPTAPFTASRASHEFMFLLGHRQDGRKRGAQPRLLIDEGR
jgi:hypothetical protein